MTKKIKKISQFKNPEESGLATKIEYLCKGLFYISESDAEILSFTGAKAKDVTKEILLMQTGADANTSAEEINFEDFFGRLTKIQSGFVEREKKRADKFKALREVLKQNLRELKVFKVGHVRLDIYVVGLDCDGKLAGIKTKAIET